VAFLGFPLLVALGRKVLYYSSWILARVAGSRPRTREPLAESAEANEEGRVGEALLVSILAARGFADVGNQIVGAPVVVFALLPYNPYAVLALTPAG